MGHLAGKEIYQQLGDKLDNLPFRVGKNMEPGRSLNLSFLKVLQAQKKKGWFSAAIMSLKMFLFSVSVAAAAAIYCRG